MRSLLIGCVLRSFSAFVSSGNTNHPCLFVLSDSQYEEGVCAANNSQTTAQQQQPQEARTLFACRVCQVVVARDERILGTGGCSYPSHFFICVQRIFVAIRSSSVSPPPRIKSTPPASSFSLS